MSDGLSRNLPEEFELILANCTAHARRNSAEVTPRFPEECRRVPETLREGYRDTAAVHPRTVYSLLKH